MAVLASFRPLKTLSLCAVIGLAGMAVVALLSIIVGIGQILSPESTFDLDEEGSVSIWLMIQGLIYLLQFPLYVYTVVIFLVWLHRAHSNLEPLRAGSLQFTPGWAVGWWFIPFANLVKPFQAVRELWCESDPEVNDEPLFLSKSVHSAPALLGAWWAFWLLSNFAANVTGRLYDPDKLANLAVTGVLFVLTGVLSVIAAVLAIMVVRDITERQNSRYTTLSLRAPASNAPPPPPVFGQNY